ncbi:hypothetical protein LTR64_002708 [Lithohypha guttulata]|uniref:uncharacterized protein n=1 Tax=Lithohypha guttulata TaxID=1690604 RepID=UPI00315D7EAC
MANLAQEEADRFFNYKPSPTSHPDDKDYDREEVDSENEKSRTRIIRSSRKQEFDEDEDTDDEHATNMGTTTGTKNSYTLPSTTHYANTGPKGVIADAQNYHKARRSTFRRTIHSITDTLSFGQKQRTTPILPEKHMRNGNSSGSDVDLDDDDEFMDRWRQQRLEELQSQFSSGNQSRPYSPARRTYGTLDQVDANGYLNAIENVPKETNVVVLLHDPNNEDSVEVEDELKMMAYKWSHIRFVKLHHEIAEMETVDIPAILAYRGGDVFATISGAEREGLEGILRSQGVLTSQEELHFDQGAYRRQHALAFLRCRRQQKIRQGQSKTTN